MANDPAAASRKIKRYGWIPDIPDARDHIYAAPRTAQEGLPPHVDLRPQCPAVYDQGHLGSCTGNAIAAAVQFDRRKSGQTPDFVPSRLFIYYNERVIEGTTATDSGAMIRDGIKCVARHGVCPELPDWPYDITRFADRPPDSAYRDARSDRAISYHRLVNTARQLKGCLAAGYPFVFGFSVYDSFESEAVAKKGVVSMPGPGERQLGGHAVMAVGYDEPTRRFIVRNSWGKTWGDGGYCTMPYAYLTDRGYCNDFWVIRTVS